MMFKH